MALQKQPVTIPLLGLDTHSDPKSAPQGSSDVAENMMYVRGTGGGVESRKRPGTTSRTRNIQGGGTISNARKMAKFYNEQLVVTDTQLYSFDPQANNYVAKGDLTPIGLSTVPVADGIVFRTSPDCAVGGGYMCSASDDGGRVLVTVTNLATGVNVLQDYQSALNTSSGTVRVVAMDTSFLVFAHTGGGAGVFSVAQIFYATPSVVSAPTALTGFAAFSFDVIKSGTSNHAMAVCWDLFGTTQLTALKVNENMTVASTFLVAEQSALIGFLLHDFSDGKAYVSYFDPVRGTRVLPITIATWVAGAVVAVDPSIVVPGNNLTGYRSGGVNTVFTQIDNFVPGSARSSLSKISRSTGGVFADWQLGACVWSRVFKVGSSYYIGAVYSDGLQDKYFILNASGATPKLIGQALDGLGHDRVTPVSVPAISSTVVAMPVLRTRGAQPNQSITPVDITGSAYLRLDFNPTLGAAKQIGDCLLFPGAIVRKYDGQRVTEAGFPLFPVLYNAVASNGAGTLAPGVYSMKACYVELDGRGNRHESAFSLPVEVTVAAPNDTITAFYTNLRIGDKITTAFVELSITDPDGDVWFAHQDVQSANADGSSFTVLNVDHLGDEIYTTGRALPHNAFPPASVIEVWRDRAFLAQTDAPNQLWVSDEIEEGKGLSVSQVNVLDLPSDDGEVSDLAEFDDRVVIGKLSGAIYQLAGSGPAANGDGQYQAPARINSTVGPLSPNGVIKTTNGLIFKSSHGLYLLPRGAADPVRLLNVEGYDSLTLMGASNVDGYEQTRLVTAEGRTLAYHYGLVDERGIGRWSTFTGQAAVDCGNFGGAWCYLSSDGTVHVEVAGTWADDGVPYARNERFTWLTAGGLFGNIRLYAAELLGEVMSSCTITTTVAYDSDSTVVDTMTKAVTVATKGALELRPSRGRSDAVQFAISETSAGEGYRITAIGLEIGTKPGFSAQAAGAFLS